ncbi:MAG: hypothetical protein QHI48_12415 [Bacteroidota bacterium]|nr:hypothetical protein [Bacteroidota bacterium]
MSRRPSLSLIGSFVLAVVVWVSVSLNNTTVSRFTIPLKVVNLPSDLAIASPLPETIEVSLEGSGWQLLLLSVGNRLVYELPGNRLRATRTILTSRFLHEALRLPEGVTAIQTYPDTLQVVVDQYMQKKVPLRFQYNELEFREGFGLAGSIRLMPDSVELMGAERILRRVESWPLTPRSWRDLSMPVVEEIPILDSLPGVVTFRQEPVRVYIPVEQFADIAFENLPVVVTELPADKQVLLVNPKVTVYVRGGVNRLATIDAADISVTVPYSAVRGDTTNSVVPNVRVPEGCTLLKVVPPRIRYTIRY